MSGAVARASVGERLLDGLKGLPTDVWLAIAFLFVAVKALAGAVSGLPDGFGDTDDATRMVQVRELLAGASWFDTTLRRFGGDAGLPSHWSRLIDLPIAALITLIGLVTTPARAELIVRAVWPLMLLFPLMVLLARSLQRVGGRLVAGLGLVLAASGVVALIQFNAGRIDHHNAQILGAVGAILLLWAWPRYARRGALAGLLAGLGLAVGFEGLVLVAAASVGIGLWALLDQKVAPTAQQFAVVMVAIMAAVFALTTPPARWLVVHCDALSLNLIVLATAATGGLLLATGPGRSWPVALRFGTVAVASGIGLAIYAALEPACLKGPFGQVPKAAGPIWLDEVSEAQSLYWYFKISARDATVAALTLLLGIAAAGRIAWTDRSGRALFLLAVIVVAGIFSCIHIKYLPYVTWLTIPPLALLFSRAPATQSISAGTVCLAAVAILNQSTLLGIAGAVAPRFVSVDAAEKARDQLRETCYKRPAFEALSGLPTGRFLADIDLGPHLVVWTEHSALQAPYHRIAPVIIDADKAFSGSPDQAMKVLAQHRIDYVAVCPHFNNPLVAKDGKGTNLASLLARGQAPLYLTPVDLAGKSPLKVWRVTPN